MIFGIGLDLCSVARIDEALKKYGHRFVERVLNERERDELGEKAKDLRTLAKAFAAKEAIAKALGTGIGQSLSFQDITIMREPSGKPYALVDGCAAMQMIRSQMPDDAPPLDILLSLTDEGEHVAAMAVISMRTILTQGRSF